MSARIRLSGIVAAFVVAAVVTGSAIERMRLPRFGLVDRSGAATVSTSLARPGRWALVYVPAACGACDAIFASLAVVEPQVLDRTIVVIGAPVEEVLATASRFPPLAAAAWYGDPDGAAVAPLRIEGSPVIFGGNGDMIEWSLGGTVAGSADGRTVLTNWIKSTQP